MSDANLIENVRTQLNSFFSKFGVNNWIGMQIPTFEQIATRHLYQLFQATSTIPQIARHFKDAQTYLDHIIPSGPTNNINLIF